MEVFWRLVSSQCFLDLVNILNEQASKTRREATRSNFFSTITGFIQDFLIKSRNFDLPSRVLKQMCQLDQQNSSFYQVFYRKMMFHGKIFKGFYTVFITSVINSAQLKMAQKTRQNCKKTLYDHLSQICSLKSKITSTFWTNSFCRFVAVLPLLHFTFSTRIYYQDPEKLKGQIIF